MQARLSKHDASTFVFCPLGLSLMSWRFTGLISIAFLLAPSVSLLSPSLSGDDWAVSALSTWKGVWSPYRILDREGIERRLIKASITLPDEAHAAARLALCDSRGTVLDSESVPPLHKKLWPHGFWLPVTVPRDLEFSVRLQSTERVIAERSAPIDGDAGALSALPLRIDRLDRSLTERLAKREESAVMTETP